MISCMISRLVIQVFGTLYPAYSSYKTVRTKNVKGYVQWMKYWIVFAFLSCVEPFCDFFFSSWVPFYYESKILMVAWLLCPVTRGYNYLYRAFLHPTLMENEEYIDGLLHNIKEQWRQAALQLGKRGSAIMVQTMLKGVLSRTAFGASFQRSSTFTDPTLAYEEVDERSINYHHQHALARTLFLSENRRNSDPNFFRQFQEKPRYVQLRSTGLTNVESVRLVDGNMRPILSKSVSVDSRDKMKSTCQDFGERLSSSLETLEEFDERVQNLSPAMNHRLACLARKLSLEGLTDEHIGTVVSTLISDFDPTVSVSSEEAEMSPKADKYFLAEDTSGLTNPSQIEELQHHSKCPKNEDRSRTDETLEKSSTFLPVSADSKQSRAGRYRKLPAPSPPESKKVSDENE